MADSQRTKSDNEKFCHECGETINAKAEICPKCGVRQPGIEAPKNVFTGEPGEHKCLNCGYQGPMKTWLGNYNMPQFIAVVLLLFYILPGVVFIAYFWNKNKCPKCGAIGQTINT